MRSKGSTGEGLTKGGAATRGLIHRALVYGSERDFAETVVPCLREGRRAGDALVAIVAPERADLLRAELDPGTARAIEFIDAAEWFTGPMATLAAYYDRTREQWWPRGRLLLLAEPPWAGRSPLEIREWHRHESLLNAAFAGSPSTFLCAYDARLPGAVLDEVPRTHPELSGPRGSTPSGRFTDPAGYYAECNAEPLAPPPAHAAERGFTSGGLPGLRAFLQAEAVRLGLPEQRSLSFVLAVNEVATNIIREGGGQGRLWVWAAGGELVCDVVDPLSALSDRFLGYAPPTGPRRGEAAMWAVRRLCHIVEIRSGASGTVIRMHVPLAAPLAGGPGGRR
ncbi:sensor histidine kinase [Spirillospora albida]|uniref:sensor histidine kinase n=1 Tax=Spirillospora albida TaxID=58123 RepID=UPI00068DB052|nr:sensor histidine kinase [Spirillospora albida]